MGNENNREDKSLPLFEIPFSRRVEEGWRHFLEEEAELRRLIDGKREGDEIGEQLEILLCPIFTEVYAEVGFHEGKYDLILNLEGDWSRLFPLVYFKKQAPKEVLEHWNILVGRQARDEESGDFQLRIEEDMVSAGDFQVWTDWQEKEAKVSVYCEKLLPLLPEREVFF